MTRTRIATRRPSVTRDVTWTTTHGSQSFSLTFGFHPETARLSEVFYSDGQRVGSQLQHEISDGCVLISLLLQHGATPDAIGHSLSRIPVLGQDAPASVIGAIVEARRQEAERMDEAVRHG